MKKEEIKQLLRQGCRGRGNAISGRELHKHLQISENEMRRQINLLRQEGVPIGSDQTGYFWAVDASEVVATIHGLEKMRAGLDRAAGGLMKALKDFKAEGG